VSDAVSSFYDNNLKTGQLRNGMRMMCFNCVCGGECGECGECGDYDDDDDGSIDRI